MIHRQCCTGYTPGEIFTVWWSSINLVSHTQDLEQTTSTTFILRQTFWCRTVWNIWIQLWVIYETIEQPVLLSAAPWTVRNYLKHKKILLKWSNIITNVLRVTKKAPVNGQSRSQSCKTIKSRCEDWDSLQHEIDTVNIDLLGGNSSYRWIFQQNSFISK